MIDPIPWAFVICSRTLKEKKSFFLECAKAHISLRGKGKKLASSERNGSLIHVVITSHVFF